MHLPPSTFQLPTSKMGQALITAVVFFVFISMAVVAAIASPLVTHLKIGREAAASRSSYFVAEALAEDIMSRYKHGQHVDPAEALTIDGNEASAVISTTLSGKAVVASGEASGAVRRVEVELTAGTGASFNYGVQAGTGGFIIGNARVEGNVYANGDITGENGATITGTAIAANSAALTSDQSNAAAIPAPNSIVFGNANATQDVAQSFEVSTDGSINKVQVYIKKTGNPGSATVRIVNNSGGNPGGATLASATLAASQVGAFFGWVDVVFPANPELSAGAAYWLVIDAATNASNYYTLAANADGYAIGGAKIGRYGTSWSDTAPANLDAYFVLFLGGLTSTITNVDIGSAGGDAHAHTVNDSTVAGNLYCATGSGNSKPCDTSKPDPSPQGFPVSDANIAEWKQEAASTTVIAGDYNVTGTAMTLGPAKITGNLNVNENNSMLTITGAVWVEGDIHIGGIGSLVKLAPSFGPDSAVVMADGRVSIANGAQFAGSGQTGSYILLLTTSDCPAGAGCGGAPAIAAANNAGTVILNAQKGTIVFANNSGAKQATAKTIELENSATIVYEVGLADQNFVSGPGGAFSINGWKEVE